MRKLVWALCVLLLAGCTLGPDFVRPEQKDQAWHAPLPHGGKLENLANWWEQFNDPLLSGLIVDAERDNPTLDQALAKVAEARANVEGSTGAYFPGVGATLSTTQSKSVFGQQLMRQRMDRAGFDASWELDLLGKNRRTVEASRASLGASVANWHQARISLAAEVADAYVSLRQSEAALAINEQTSLSRTSTAQMVSVKQSAGLASMVEAARGEANAADSASTYAARQGDYARALNKLTALTGLDAQGLQARLAAKRGQIPLPNLIDVSRVAVRALSQRPDVAAAELELAAASAQIGAKKAELFPSLTLVGSIGINRLHAGGANLQASTWSFGPSLFIPVFDAGRRKSVVAATRARYDYAQAGYRKTVREAVHEIEDALVRLDVANSRLAESRRALAQYQLIYKAAQTRRDAGMYNLLDLEEAHRNALQSQENEASSGREAVSAWIALYKALGGGWDGTVNQESVAAGDSGDKSGT
ncbi:MAG: efflux transporter outer membrane subunit [Gallionella sp.]|jgi:NodT family efflux transporter outer membrane factor (OMF) lipoprotein